MTRAHFAFLPLAIATALAPSSALAGVWIGHPSLTVHTESSQATVTELRLDDCVGGTVVLPTDQDIDLVQGAWLSLPEGAWCGLEVQLEDLLIQGISEEESSFTVVLDEAFGHFDSAFVVTEASDIALFVGAPELLESIALELPPGTHSFVEGVDAQPVASSLVQDSWLEE